jgi:hypothetical protein
MVPPLLQDLLAVLDFMYQVQVQKSLLEIMVLYEPHCIFIKLGTVRNCVGVVVISVADPGCLYQIGIFFCPGSRVKKILTICMRIKMTKELMYFNTKNCS